MQEKRNREERVAEVLRAFINATTAQRRRMMLEATRRADRREEPPRSRRPRAETVP